jgi:hypothetical protein
MKFQVRVTESILYFGLNILNPTYKIMQTY